MHFLPGNHSFWLLLLFAVAVGSCKQEKKAISEQEFKERQQQLVEVNKILVRKDQQRIAGYVERHKLDMRQTETGLWYQILEQGKGPLAEEGKTIVMNYTLSLLDGTVCYHSETKGPKSFRIGRGGVESGLEEAVLLLNEGAKAKFILPPYLAFGLPGDGDCIPARAIILYDVEVVSIQ